MLRLKILFVISIEIFLSYFGKWAIPGTIKLLDRAMLKALDGTISTRDCSKAAI